MVTRLNCIFLTPHSCISLKCRFSSFKNIVWEKLFLGTTKRFLALIIPRDYKTIKKMTIMLCRYYRIALFSKAEGARNVNKIYDRRPCQEYIPNHIPFPCTINIYCQENTQINSIFFFCEIKNLIINIKYNYICNSQQSLRFFLLT